MKTLKSLLGFLIIVGMGFSGYKLIPAYFANYQFQDVLETEARNNSYAEAPKSDDEIRTSIYSKAQELGVPIVPGQVQIRKAGTEYVISADYTVHVELLVRSVDLDFHTSSKK